MDLPALSPDDCLGPTGFLDTGHPAVVAYTERALVGAGSSPRERAVALFHAVRDGIPYDPYVGLRGDDGFRASAVAATPRNWCVPKSVLLAAACRVAGVPAALGFADVRNHLQSGKLLETMGTDLFVWHGYAVLWVDGRWQKVSSAFNVELCARFGTKVLEWDGTGDALMHAHDQSGKRHMEYVRDRGIYTDLPLDAITATYAEVYRGWSSSADRPTDARSAGDDAFA